MSSKKAIAYVSTKGSISSLASGLLCALLVAPSAHASGTVVVDQATPQSGYGVSGSSAPEPAPQFWNYDFVPPANNAGSQPLVCETVMTANGSAPLCSAPYSDGASGPVGPTQGSAGGGDVFLTSLYIGLLSRLPDPEGLRGWKKAYGSGAASSAIALGFINSAEFNERKLSDAEFVDALYSGILNRAPDSEGKQGWINKLSSGSSRSEVAMGFINAEEFADRCNQLRSQEIRAAVMAPQGPSCEAGMVLRMQCPAAPANPLPVGMQRMEQQCKMACVSGS